MRAALGAGRWRIVRQLLAEALLLTAVGTASRIVLAWLGIHELLAIAPANLPRLEAVRIDAAVLVFAAAVALAAALLSGLVPASAAFRLDLMHVLRGGSRTSGLRGGGVMRNAVVIGEVALCFALLIVGHGLRLSAAGVIVGVAAAFVLTRAMATMLVGVKPGDPATFAAMGAAFFAIAVVSSWLPAQRAAALDPTVALRE